MSVSTAFIVIGGLLALAFAGGVIAWCLFGMNDFPSEKGGQR